MERKNNPITENGVACTSCHWTGEMELVTTRGWFGNEPEYEHYPQCPACGMGVEPACRCIDPECGELYRSSEYVDGFCPDHVGSVQCTVCDRFWDAEDVDSYGVCDDCAEVTVCSVCGQLCIAGWMEHGMCPTCLDAAGLDSSFLEKEVDEINKQTAAIQASKRCKQNNVKFPIN